MTLSNWDKCHARRLGITEDEYAAQIDAGNRLCHQCKTWHPAEEFGRDASAPDGRARRCKKTEAARSRERSRRRREGTPLRPREQPDVLSTVYSMLQARRPHGEIIDVIRETVGRVG